MKIYKEHYHDIDEIIGNKDSRFFGNGFSKVENRLFDIDITCKPTKESCRLDSLMINRKEPCEGYVSARGGLSYPLDWSQKSESIELKPHLSTIDALNMAVQLNEMYLVYRYSLTANERSRMWICKYSISAGNAPFENLDNFEICTICKYTKEEVGKSGIYISSFESIIGALKVTCEIVHEIHSRVVENPRVSYSDGDDLLGNSYERYYGNGYRYTVYDVEDVRIDMNSQKISNVVQIKRSELSNRGLEGAYQPSISMIDSIILCGQLAQVLLYSIDEVDRSETGTLWMRKVTMESSNPNQPCDFFQAITHLVNGKIINMRNRPWRKADLHSVFNGITCDYSLAYELSADN